MTAPAKAAPMREDVTQDRVQAAYDFMRKLPESTFAEMAAGEDGETLLNLLVGALGDARHRLAHTARPDAGDDWLNNPLSLDAGLPDAGDEDVERVALKQCCEDNYALKQAGTKLAAAGLLVATEYDGIHRLHLALSEWALAVANEGGRAERYAAMREGVDPDAATGCADDQAFANVSEEVLRSAIPHEGVKNYSFGKCKDCPGTHSLMCCRAPTSASDAVTAFNEQSKQPFGASVTTADILPREGVDRGMVERAKEIEEAAKAVLVFKCGQAPSLGYIKDNGQSRAAIARLAAALDTEQPL